MDPCSAEEHPGELPRVVFRSVPGHRHDELWQDRPVRAQPATSIPCGRLAYHNSSKTASNSNVLQVILRDHGYERVESLDEAWSVFWCAGQMDPSLLTRLLPHQKVNKFPRATALTLKANLWMNVKQMQQKHGIQHFGFMPPTFVLPRELKAFERELRDQVAAPNTQGAPAPVGIFKPAAA